VKSGFKFPSSRHFYNGLTIPKQAGNSIFTISKNQVKPDVEEINNGAAQREGNLFVVSSGRSYGVHDDILYPIEGPGIVNLSSQQYNLLVQFKKSPENALKTKNKLLEKGIISTDDGNLVETLASFFSFV
jgi:hypothetical protein